MKVTSATQQRLQFLCRVVEKECKHLEQTRQRLFTPSFTLEVVAQLEQHPNISERVEAFVGRFGRLQDTLGDKLLPLVLASLGERLGSVTDNLDRAERLNLLPSADEWFAMRSLRNQMVHEYVEDAQILFGALDAGRAYTGQLLLIAQTLLKEEQQRGWLAEP